MNCSTIKCGFPIRSQCSVCSTCGRTANIWMPIDKFWYSPSCLEDKFEEQKLSKNVVINLRHTTDFSCSMSSLQMATLCWTGKDSSSWKERKNYITNLNCTPSIKLTDIKQVHNQNPAYIKNRKHFYMFQPLFVAIFREFQYLKMSTALLHSLSKVNVQYLMPTEYLNIYVQCYTKIVKIITIQDSYWNLLHPYTLI